MPIPRPPAALALALALAVLVLTPAASATPPPAAAGAGQDPAAAALPARTPAVTLRGSGWGHSVGMSQYGARALAQAGRSAAQILGHYYPGVQVGTAGSLPAATEVRVELLDGRVGAADAQRVELAARGRSGASGPTTAATVRMAPGRPVRALPPPDRPLTIARSGDAFVLRDAAGAELERSSGPVQLDVAPPGGANPGLLCLPQRGCSSSSLAGTFQWGFVSIRWDAGAARLRPVLHVPLELYLRGLAEMPSDWETPALQAQAVAGRTFVSRRVGDAAWHVDTTPRTQAYAGWAKEGAASGARWVQAVDSTTRQVVTYGGRLAETYYSSSHGGRTEDVQDSWAFGATTTEFPYLRSVDDPWSLRAGNPYAAWTATVSNSEFASTVGQETGIARVASVGVTSRTPGGTPRTLSVRGWTPGGTQVTRLFRGAKNAGAELRLRWPTRDGQPFVRSQQLRSFSVSPFTDDDGSVHEYNVLVVSERGITRGCAPDRFCPSRTLTRGQLATFLARTLGLELDTGANRFRDIGAHPHRSAINALAAAGLTEGCSADGPRYCPDDGVTRAQMASFLARAFELPPAPDPGFRDVDASSPHRDAIARVAASGITGGCAQGRYCPADAVPRAQMASFLARALDDGW